MLGGWTTTTRSHSHTMHIEPDPMILEHCQQITGNRSPSPARRLGYGLFLVSMTCGMATVAISPAELRYVYSGTALSLGPGPTLQDHVMEPILTGFHTGSINTVNRIVSPASLTPPERHVKRRDVAAKSKYSPDGEAARVLQSPLFRLSLLRSSFHHKNHGISAQHRLCPLTAT